jgi:arylsulfatase A-like enzyme/Tfp pilus assembly protein PilF
MATPLTITISHQPLAITAAAAVIIAGTACSPAPVAKPPAPNILLITIDTWRADRLGAGVSPNLDRIAATGVRFTAARSAVPLTLPSHTTILTGLLPPAHGVRENGIDSLSDAHPTVARLLQQAGYHTAAFVGAYVLDRRFGLANGFDTYDDRIPRDPNATDRLEAERPASAVVDAAIAWLEANLNPKIPAPPTPPASRPAPPALPAPPAVPAAPAPFFVWLHLYDPHAPYTPPAEFRGRTSTAYDDEIAYADSQVARVFDWLRAHALADRTLAVIAGDHGEGLGDHGERTHGMLLYDSTLRVPLVISGPDATAAVRDEAVSLADVAPTILRAARVAPPKEMKGRDLLQAPYDDGEARDLYSETDYPHVAGWSPLQALTDGRWTTIRAGSDVEVYDLSSDPRQLHNIAPTQGSIATAMSVRIDAIRAAANSSAAPAVPPDAVERLRALGYVSTAASSSNHTNAANPANLIGVWNHFEDALSALNARRPDALAVLEPLAREHPESLVFQTTTARALKESGNLTKALTIYRRAAHKWPTDAALLHDLAVAARDAAQAATGSAAIALRDEAEKAERAAAALSPQSAMAHNGLGLIAIDDGRPQDAAAEFERAAAIDPNNASYAANLGNARRAAGDRAGAEQAYRRALEIDPRTADADNGLGVLLVEAHRPADAILRFERALAAAPDAIEARLNLGIALQESGQRARAADTYREVLKSPARFARERAVAAKLLAALGDAR